MSRTSRATALTILPLAVAAIAQAGVILDPTSGISGGGGCSSSGGAVSCTLSQLPADGSGSQGIGWVLDAPYSLDSGFGFDGYTGANPVVGSLPSGILPFAWSMSLSGDVAVELYLYANTIGPSDGQSFVFGGPGLHSGFGTLTLSGGIADGGLVQLGFFAGPGALSDLILGDTGPSIDSFSLQFFPVSAVPEPGTLLLMGGAMGALGLLIRRKRSAQL